MIPKYLSFEAFGPYVERQEIDFTEFEYAGLFLIWGETGAGKTVILDAMTYALFGMAIGGERGDITNMRSDYAVDAQPTEVEFIFSVTGREYKFTRHVAVHVRRNGKKEYRRAQNAFYRNQKGIFEPFFENPKIVDVQQKAEEISGLTFEQFRQVTMLPQGQFEKLLVADSATKEQILTTLFGAEKWQKITDWLCEKANAMKRKNDEEEIAMRAALTAQHCTDVEQLEALLHEKQKGLQAASAAREVAVREETEVSRILADAQENARLFSEYEQLQVRLEKLKAQADIYRKKEMLLRRSADAA
jgi:exonuclease SbcC